MNHLATARGRAPHSERPSRELPVLFHLMDVSRPRPVAPLPDAPSADAPSTNELVPAAVSQASPIELPPATPPSAEPPIADFSPTEPLPPEPIVVSQPPVAEAGTASPPASTAPTKFSLDRPIELCMTPSAPAADTAAVTQPSEEPPNHLTDNYELQAAVEHPVTPRPPFETRRKFRMPLSEDWFAAHGRYIAVVFVLALIGTVYLARTNRRPAKDPAASTQMVANIQIDKAASVEAPAIVISAAPPLNSAAGAPPKLVDTASATSDARTELHPPTAPEVAAKTATENKTASADNLFVFPQAKKAEERVATRPDAPQTIVNPTVTTPAPAAAPFASAGSSNFSPPAAPAMPTPQAPSLSPAYPTTAMPPVNYPTTSPPQHAYPTTAAPPLAEAHGPAMPPRVAPGQPSPYQPVYSPTNTFQSPPVNPGQSAWQPPTTQMPAARAPAAQGTWTPNVQGAWTPNAPGEWSPPASGGGMPPPYQPQDNSARGFRNERTGSSLY